MNDSSDPASFVSSDKDSAALGVDVLVIGAGMSGLVAAQNLSEQGFSVLVLDKGRGVGGRMASRRIQVAAQEACFDHGAQYLTARNPVFNSYVERWQRAEALGLWFEDTCPTDGSIQREKINRYIGPKGMTSLPKHLAKTLNVRLGQRVSRLALTCEGWEVWAELLGQEDAPPVSYKASALLVTCPLPQTLALLNQSDLDLDPEQRVALEAVDYEPCLSLMVQLDGPSALVAPGGVFGPQAGEPLGWVADNYLKGISPLPGSLTVQAGPAYSRQNLEADTEKTIAELLAFAQPYFGSAKVVQRQLHRWRYAFPSSYLPELALRLKGLPPCVLAGDAFGGKARVETAALSGLEAAKLLPNLLPQGFSLGGGHGHHLTTPLL